jgi:tetratricopeptide (TPR) repeat protein
MIAVFVIYLLASLGFLLAHCGVITGGSPRFTGLLPCVIVALLTGCFDRLGHQTDQQLVGVAERAMNAEKYGQALEAMNVLVERNPRNFNYLSGRAMILSLSGRVEAALADFDRCIASTRNKGDRCASLSLIAWFGQAVIWPPQSNLRKLWSCWILRSGSFQRRVTPIMIGER